MAVAMLCDQVHPTTTDSGQFALQFEHPTLASGVGCWMNRADKIVEEPVEVRTMYVT
jgi:hypothetical protein